MGHERRRCASIAFGLTACLSVALLVCLRSALGQTTTAPAPTAATAAPEQTRDAAQQNTPAALIVLQGPIDDFNRDALFRRFAQARGAGAKTVILRIDTYGGLVTAGLDISRFIKRQNDLHTIALV